jgi:hypothetical protein
LGLRSLFRRGEADRELNEELGEFLEMATQEKMRQGVTQRDALREVRLERGRRMTGVKRLSGEESGSNRKNSGGVRSHVIDS